MRALVVASPGTGHVFPLVPVSWALRSHSHDVLVATTGDGIARAMNAGLTVVDVSPGVNMRDVFMSVGPGPGGWKPNPAPADAREQAVQLFARVSKIMLAGTESVARRWRPDVMIYGELQGAGALVAARLGVPAVEHAISLAGGGGVFVPQMWSRLAPGPVVEPVAVIRIAPPSLTSAARGWTVRPVPYNGGAVVPEELLSPPTRPRILITMGTVVPLRRGVGLVRDLVDAVVTADRSMDVLVALGCDPAELGSLPGSVRAYQWLPLSATLPTCSVVIHHGGAGTTLSALAAGVPQVVVPQGADQFLNAESVSRRGCAMTADLAPVAINECLRRALSGELDRAAKEVRDEIATLATPSEIAIRLVRHLNG
jgi:UDP:flavonoid glycosyltransferase YjiC (YdhE family)